MEHQQQTPTTHPQGVSCGQHQALRYLGTGLTQPGLTWRIPEIWISPLWYPHAIPIINGYKGWYLMGIAWGSNISSEWNWSWPHGGAFHWNGNGIRGRNKANSFMIAAIFSLVNYYNSARRNPKIWSLEWWDELTLWYVGINQTCLVSYSWFPSSLFCCCAWLGPISLLCRSVVRFLFNFFHSGPWTCPPLAAAGGWHDRTEACGRTFQVGDLWNLVKEDGWWLLLILSPIESTLITNDFPVLRVCRGKIGGI